MKSITLSFVPVTGNFSYRVSRHLDVRPKRLLQLAGLFVCIFIVFPVRAEEPQTLPEVKVTGKADDVAERREATTQKVMLERKDIESMGVMTIGEVLGKLPGVELASGGMGQRARGMSRDSVQILVDGERSAGGGAMVGVVGRLPSGDLDGRSCAARRNSAVQPVTVNLIERRCQRALRKSGWAGQARNGPYSQLARKENGGEGGFSWSLPISLIWSDSPVARSIDRQDTAAGVRTWAAGEREWRDRGAHRYAHDSKDGSDSLTAFAFVLWTP